MRQDIDSAFAGIRAMPAPTCQAVRDQLAETWRNRATTDADEHAEWVDAFKAALYDLDCWCVATGKAPDADLLLWFSEFSEFEYMPFHDADAVLTFDPQRPQSPWEIRTWEDVRQLQTEAA